MFRAYCHKINGSEELLIMMWNDKEPVKTTITIDSDDFKLPVSISIFNYHKWTDVDCDISDAGTVIDTIAGPEPRIIRLFSAAAGDN